jgi:3-hydroxyacyl-[acyl-carrier-protein] dehydratase
VTSSDPCSLGLPHRDPFIFVDEVLDLDPGRTATCRKLFRADLDCFRGHFPGNPIIPGVLLIEAMAQTAGIAAVVNNPEARPLLLAAVRSMKFHQAAPAGTEVELRATKTGETDALMMFDVNARSGDTLLASGSLILSASPGPGSI